MPCVNGVSGCMWRRGARRSVSYTHLDVYKRQGYLDIESEPGKGSTFSAQFSRRILAVSYTHLLKESAYALGCTRWEVMKNIVLHYTRNGVVGGIMLGLGRALGETMAVTFVIGNANRCV